MSSIDLEQFPKSAAAQRMLSYVTKGWYDNSYIGKWIYEVMGREIDNAAAFYDELPLQFFVSTATWGLCYHELKYGLDVRKDLSYEERRARIIERRESKYSMTPYRMETVLGSYANCNVRVTDINEDGCVVAHPNIIEVEVSDDRAISVSALIKKLNQIKLSHTTYILSIYSDVCITIEEDVSKSTKVIYRLCGTYPGVSTRACINDTKIELIDAATESIVPYAFAEDTPAGLQPILSIGTGINEIAISLAADDEGIVSIPGMSGERVVGVSPDVNISSCIDSANLRIDAGDDATRAVYTISGEKPRISMGSNINSTSLDIQMHNTTAKTTHVVSGEESAGMSPNVTISEKESQICTEIQEVVNALQTFYPPAETKRAHTEYSPKEMGMSVDTEKYVIVYPMCGEDDIGT